MWLAATLLLAAQVALAVDPPAVQWTRNYYGRGAAGGDCLLATSDGGYVVAGWTDSSGPTTEFYIAKTDSLGLLEWEKWYGGARNAHIYSVVQTGDGGYAFAGEKDEGAYLCRTDSIGNLLWETNLFAGDTCIAWASAVRQTADGGFVVTAMASGDFIQGVDTTVGVFVIKTNPSGNREWRLGVPEDWMDDDIGIPVEVTSGGAYVIAYISWADGTLKLVKVGPTGSVNWAKELTGVTTSTSAALAVAPGGGYIVAGPCAADTSEFDPANTGIVRIDSVGNKIWSKNIGGRNLDMGVAVTRTAGNGLVIAGEIRPSGRGDTDAYLFETDSQGNVLWTTTYGASGSEEYWTGVLRTANGGTVVAGGVRGASACIQKLASENR
jgi:hypothetical protein